MEFIKIGDPGNPADTHGSYYNGQYKPGACAHTFYMARTHVTREEYVEFLNSADPTGDLFDTLAVYEYEVKMDKNFPPGARYVVNRDYYGEDNLPVYVNWWNAVRFCNWLHFGKSGRIGGTDTEGAYDTRGLEDEGPDTRNPGARYWLPDWDEWAKAAYYNPADQTYCDYPTKSYGPRNEVLGGNPPGQATPPGHANLRPRRVGWTYPPHPGKRTPVGVYAAESFYGVKDLAGNIDDWLENRSDDIKVQYPGYPEPGSRTIHGGNPHWFPDHALKRNVAFGTHKQHPSSWRGIRICASVEAIEQTEPQPTEPTPPPPNTPEILDQLSEVAKQIDGPLSIEAQQHADVWESVRSELQSIAAEADDDAVKQQIESVVASVGGVVSDLAALSAVRREISDAIKAIQ